MLNLPMLRNSVNPLLTPHGHQKGWINKNVHKNDSDPGARQAETCLACLLLVIPV